MGDAASQHAQAIELLSEALGATARAAALARQLLTFSRGGEPSRKATSELGKLLLDVASFAARGTSVRCEVDVQQPLGVVEIDAGQIAQVIQNLVINACQASSSGAVVSLRARRVTAGADLGFIAIQVIDTGRGIAPEHLAHIFEPFFTARVGGTGLGLAVSHSIVRRHGGRLLVESELGRGTTFTVELPASGTATPPVRAPEDAASRRFSGRALVMDDEDSVRLVATRLLQRLGFDVDAACDGKQALELGRLAAAEGRPFRVAILDLTVVGGLGGADIAAKLRAASSGIRLVLSTGHAAVGGDEAWDARLLKPYKLDELAGALEQALQAP